MKKSNFGLFFKKLPDDYLFESMIIFCIFFGAIPETHFPRDIKFNLSSVPAQCAMYNSIGVFLSSLSANQNKDVLGRGYAIF